MPLLKKSSNPTVEAQKQDVPTVEQLAKTEIVKKNIAKTASSEIMTKADWANKDQRISRQGLFQACLQSVGLLQLNTGNTLDDYLKLVEQAAERGLQFVGRS
jgi:hypothetical protein